MSLQYFNQYMRDYSQLELKAFYSAGFGLVKVQARLYKHYHREDNAAASKLTVGPAILVEGLLGGLAGAMKTSAGPAAKRALQLKVKSLAFLDQILKRGVIEETPMLAKTREADCKKTYVVESPVKNAEGQLVSEGRVVSSETFAKEVKGNLKLNEAGDAVPGCFAYDTFVWTEQGVVEIQFLTPGAEVLSRCEVTGEISPRKVVNHFIYEDRQIYIVALTYEKDGEKFTDTIDTTAEHPFWIAGKGWTEVRHLEIGQMMVTREGGTARITDVTKTNRFRQVFNIEVEGFHTYFVGCPGIWVHNKSVGSYGPHGEVLPRSHPDATVVPGKNVPNPSRQALHQA